MSFKILDAAESFRFDQDDSDNFDRAAETTASGNDNHYYSPRRQSWYDVWMQSYMNRLDRDPLVTKSITCAVVSALGALLGNLPSKDDKRRQQQRQQAGTGNSSNNSHQSLQILAEVLAFALYGGLVGGPITHYWHQWLEKQRNNSSGNSSATASSSWTLILDQLVAQPPLLFLMHLVLDMTGAAVRQLPHSWNRSLERTGPSLVLSWRYWPAVVYIM